MGLEINRGNAVYSWGDAPANPRSLSAKRAHILRWHKEHPHSFRLFQKAELQLEKSHEKLRAYNETGQRLQARIGKTPKKGERLPLIASFQRVCNLKGDAEKEIARQAKARDRLAQHLYDWRETLPLLDGQIAQARARQPGRERQE